MRVSTNFVRDSSPSQLLLNDLSYFYWNRNTKLPPLAGKNEQHRIHGRCSAVASALVGRTLRLLVIDRLFPLLRSSQREPLRRSMPIFWPEYRPDHPDETRDKSRSEQWQGNE